MKRLRRSMGYTDGTILGAAAGVTCKVTKSKFYEGSPTTTVQDKVIVAAKGMARRASVRS